MNHATAKITEHPKPDNELIEQLRQEVQDAKTLDEGFTAINAFFETLEITIERITLVRNGETSEVTINQNASGIRREFNAQFQNTELTVICINSFTPDLNALLQSLVTLAAAASQHWLFRPVESSSPIAPTSRMIGDSPQMRDLSLEIATAARSKHIVFIKGESGTGKTTAALMVHEQGPRSTKPFVDINCAALPEELIESELFGYEKGAFTGAAGTKKGLFEIANGGTLFLDEIGEMTLKLQAKLLKAIEQKKIRRLGSTKDVPCDVRIITASSRNIRAMIKAGTFREDLYYRIAVLEIQIPPLRERPADIPALVHHRLCIEQELAGCNEPYQIEPLALKALTLYEWPGNIRELQNIISRLAARANTERPITQTDVLSKLSQEAIHYDSLLLPNTARVINPDEDLHAFIARIQLLAIESTVKATGNATNAAYRLGYGRTSLLALKNNLQKGIHRRTKRTSPSPTNPNQPLLPVD